jgi:ATP-dependent Clp protease ATP-binding subunit ClpA
MYTLYDSAQPFKPAVRLEQFISRRTLGSMRAFGLAAFLLGGAAASTLHFYPSVFADYYMYRNYAAGISLLGLAVWTDTLLAICYHNNYYFKGLNSILGLEETPAHGATYDVAAVTLSNPDDVGKAFVESTFGQTVLMRSGLTPDQIDSYVQAKRQPITASMVSLPQGEVFSLIGLGKYLLTHDATFAALLHDTGTLPEHFLGSLRWIMETHHQEKRIARWWSRDNLSKTTRIGSELSYGVAYLLMRYSKNIQTTAIFSTLTRDSSFAASKVSEIETTLARSQSANVLLIGEAGVGKTDLIMEVRRRMQTGEALNSLTNEHIVVLDTSRLFATHKDKQSLELTLLSMLNQAANAGHTTIVIENLSTVIKEAEGTGVFLPELLDEYLALPNLHFIMTDTPAGYHTHLETLGGFTRRFTEILIDTPDDSATVRVLQNIALQEEARRGVVFTYSSLVAIAAAANRYIVQGVMPDKAVSLLLEVASNAHSQTNLYITADFVYSFVSQKTGVPAGPIKDTERDLLLHLEDKLHNQVVGQRAAISAIAKTMRRARTGIQASDKPMGSFLFLGPTGVGKTETAKALATVFFGGEHTLQRIDMSEFSGSDSLAQLIGTADSTGTLPTVLREHPYSVVLLDEFEKASQSVHDVFLQVLDEGMFTDGRGQKVNARNTIIIATSNAGSKLIIETVQSRQTLQHLNQSIIDHIIADGLFRPELINRFSSTIIFEPLTLEEQGQVASMMLKELNTRVKQKGYDLVVGEELLQILVQKGYHPEFGARPMQRVMQDTLEEKVAQKIIEGSVQKGDTISLTKADFTPEELAV